MHTLLSLFGAFMDFYFMLNSLLGLSSKPTESFVDRFGCRSEPNQAARLGT